MQIWSLGGEDPLEEGIGTHPQYPCRENPMDKGAGQTTVHRIAKSWTRLKQLSMYVYTRNS